MSPDAFVARAKSLEDLYFSKADEEAIDRLKKKMQHAATLAELKHLTGITHESVLESLASLNVGATAILLMSYYPMIAVAWADGEVVAAERELILQLAAMMGVKPKEPAYDYLEQWLREKPELRWTKLWTEYVQALSEQMRPDDRSLLKNTVLGRARVVAEVTGGIMGVLWNVSHAEKQVLKQLESAFESQN